MQRREMVRKAAMVQISCRVWAREAKVRTEGLPVICLDSREPLDHPWAPYLTLPTTRGTLDTGDVSLAGCGELIAIERKSLDDLISYLCTGRERFTKELARAARIRDFYVICEDSYADRITDPSRSREERYGSARD